MTHQQTLFNLPKPPNAVSVSSDGLSAAVAHDALISYVNLSAASIQQTFPVPITVQDVILGESWIYALSNSGSLLSVAIATGAASGSIYDGSPGGRLNTAVNAIYGASEYGDELAEYNISTGLITGFQTSSYAIEYPICAPIWFSPDGSRVYTGCGTVFHASTNSALDLRYETSFAGTSNIASLSQSTPLSMVATVQSAAIYQGNDTVVTLSDSTYLQPLGQFVLPGFTSGSASSALMASGFSSTMPEQISSC